MHSESTLHGREQYVPLTSSMHVRLTQSTSRLQVAPSSDLNLA
jgi:hypothetical protein